MIAAWSRLTAEGRRFTVGDVRAVSRAFPPPRTTTYSHDATTVRRAAALVPVVDIDGEAGLVVTKRPSGMTYHRNDWVFPGGRIDPGEGPSDAALREVEEELGFPRERVELLAELDTYGPFVTGFLLQVFLGVLTPPVELHPHPGEVEAVLVVPISRFLGDGVYHRGPIPAGHDPGPSSRPTPNGSGSVRFFAIAPDHSMWGTQGDIVWSLLTQLAQSRLAQPQWRSGGRPR